MRGGLPEGNPHPGHRRDVPRVHALALHRRRGRGDGLGQGRRGLTEAGRKRRGAFPTPPDLARALAQSCLDALGDLDRPTILDPACGEGALLEAAFHELVSRGARPDAALEALHGIEIDSDDAHRARARLRELWRRHVGTPAPASLDSQIVTGDALFLDAPAADAVLMNPPFVSFSGRHAVTMGEAGRRRLASRFETFSRWPALHVAFVERAFELSRHVVAAILPSQVAHLSSYEPVRRFATSRARVVSIREWPEDAFDAVTPAMSVVLRRSTEALPSSAPWLDSQPVPPLGPTVPLGPLVSDPGVHTGNCAARLVGDLGEPLLEGRCIGRYACAPAQRRLNVEVVARAGEYFRIRPRARYEAAPFVIRQTASRPIVGPRLGATYFRNSLLALAAPDDGRDVRFLVGVLNSNVAAELFRAREADGRQRAFPQVKVRALRELPVPAIDLRRPAGRALHDEIVTQVERLLATPPGAAFDALDARVEALVRAAYGL